MILRWSHNPAITVLGVGNAVTLQIPLECMRKDDELIFQKMTYQPIYKEIHIEAHIIRRPFLSQYLEMQRFEPEREPELR